MATITNRFGLKSSHSDPKLPTLFGLECEIESLYDWPNFDGIAVTEDGSLRNNGREFLTSPSNQEETLFYFLKLHECLKFQDKSQAFSDRTSIHVHVNCKNLEETTVRNIVLWYALYEEMFFRMVNKSRRDNIHCVALTDTHLPAAFYRTPLQTMVSRWSKYTALNLLPLAKLGTLEFRHMHGHDDPKLLEQWLGSISTLFEVGKNIVLTPDALNERTVQQTYEQIFAGTKVLQEFPVVFPFIENSLIDVKLGLI